MFRPYSFTSIAAWTAGALAGNQAYYEARRGKSSAKLSSKFCPSQIRILNRRLENMARQCESIFKAQVKDWNKASELQKKLELTSYVKLCACKEWLHKNKKSLRSEIRSAYLESTNAGYIWPASIVEDVCGWLDNIIMGFDSTTELFEKRLLEALKSSSQAQKQVFDAIKRYQKNFRVDIESLKLLGSANKRLILAFEPPNSKDSF